MPTRATSTPGAKGCARVGAHSSDPTELKTGRSENSLVNECFYEKVNKSQGRRGGRP